MEYQIQYNLNGKSKSTKPVAKWLKYGAYGLMFLCICELLIWTAGVDLRAVWTAAEIMADALKQGSGVKDAFSEFCLDILRGAV